jgi:hypothetical protein
MTYDVRAVPVDRERHGLRNGDVELLEARFARNVLLTPSGKVVHGEDVATFSKERLGDM